MMPRPLRHTILPTLLATVSFFVVSEASAQSSRGLAGSISRSVNQAVTTGNTAGNTVAVGVNRNQTSAGTPNTVINTTPGFAINVNRGRSSGGTTSTEGTGGMNPGSSGLSTK